MRVRASGQDATVTRLAGLVALVASAGLAACTCDFDKFAEQREAAVCEAGRSCYVDVCD